MAESDGAGSDRELRWRVEQVEGNYTNLDKKLDQAISTFGAGLTAIQTQLTAYQQALARDFLSIREADERQRATDARLTEALSRVDALTRENSARGWGTAAALFTGGIAFLGVALSTVTNFLKPHP